MSNNKIERCKRCNEPYSSKVFVMCRECRHVKSKFKVNLKDLVKKD